MDQCLCDPSVMVSSPWQRIHGMRFKEVSGVGLWVEYTLPGKPWLAAILAAWCGTRKQMLKLEANLGRSNDSFKQNQADSFACVCFQTVFHHFHHHGDHPNHLCSHCPYDLFLPSTFASSRSMFKHSFYILSYLVIIHDMNNPNPFIEDRAHLALRLAAEKLSAMKKQNTPQPSGFLE